ncbi:MAG TPA: hypothetical protein VGZ26_07765, partial [Pirellulales bacterium]|nr:hypothetical protein [Pirellulales bacterium]
MHRNVSNQPGDGSDGKAPTEAWLFAQAVFGNPIPKIVRPEVVARAKRAELEQLARISSRHAEELSSLQYAEAAARHDRELLEWAARISTRAEEKLRALQQQEAAEREAWNRAEKFVEMLESNWDSSKHPRAPKGQPEGGQWIEIGGGAGVGTVAAGYQPGPFRTAAFQAGQAAAQPVGTGGGPTATWPTTGPTSSWLPKVGSGAAAGAGAAAGIGAGAFLGGLRNASMGIYWQRMPGSKAMPSIWVYELEKRVRAGTLSREDAIGIFNTAVLGAEAQNFKPTGGTSSAVHKSATDFLNKAEAVYFARKKETAHGTKNIDAENAEAKPERVTGESLDKARREFEGMKRQLWKKEAAENPQKYTQEQLEKMRGGDAPTGADGRPME